MSNMYGVIGNTTRKIKKQYAVIGGKTRKIKKMYAVVNGLQERYILLDLVMLDI